MSSIMRLTSRKQRTLLTGLRGLGCLDTISTACSWCRCRAADHTYADVDFRLHASAVALNRGIPLVEVCERDLVVAKYLTAHVTL